jgi:uncharacterized protein
MVETDLQRQPIPCFVCFSINDIEMPETKQYNHTNPLIDESSPYLLQHAHNPVDWMPWGRAAFEKAQKENKLVLVSIGYAACHWCHVMEHQSFEDPEVARAMNENFICIKVDREERPDVDKVYMDAVQLLTRSGGWPLNCFALPDGRPVYGGTYYPKDNWLYLLGQLAQLYKTERDKLIEQAASIEQGMVENDLYFIHKPSNKSIDHVQLVQRLYPNFDLKDGGFSGAPKFPMPVVWEYLLAYAVTNGDKEILGPIQFFLNKLSNGGICDHVGGGFARYSVDAAWHVPHFEKMLYDNAQLVSLFAHAYQHTQNSYFLQVVEECLEFAQRDMRSPEGGFYCAYDADSEGEEGKYYTWTAHEFEAIVGADAKLLSDYFQVQPEGNWEKKWNILHAKDSPEAFSRLNHLDVQEFTNILMTAKGKLLDVRKNRVPPLLDHKILLSWNALMVKGYIDAYKASGNESLLSIALKTATFLRNNYMAHDHSVYRTFQKGEKGIKGFLDDYAFFTEALIECYQVTFDETWLHHAQNLLGYTLQHFYDESTGLFYYTEADGEVSLKRKFEVMDNVIPSSNAVMADNLHKMYRYFNQESYGKAYATMLKTQTENIQHLRSFARWAQLMMLEETQSFEIVVVGPAYEKFTRLLQGHYIPGAIYAGSGQPSELPLLKGRWVNGKTLVYICRDKVCQRPVETVEEALGLIKNNH